MRTFKLFSKLIYAYVRSAQQRSMAIKYMFYIMKLLCSSCVCFRIYNIYKSSLDSRINTYPTYIYICGVLGGGGGGDDKRKRTTLCQNMTHGIIELTANNSCEHTLT